MSHRMKMNQHIITMARPPGDAKLFKSHCSGAFLAPPQVCGNACSRCCGCKGLLSINGQRMHPITDQTLATRLCGTRSHSSLSL
jgi:hypothetical protein